MTPAAATAGAVVKIMACARTVSWPAAWAWR